MWFFAADYLNGCGVSYHWDGYPCDQVMRAFVCKKRLRWFKCYIKSFILYRVQVFQEVNPIPINLFHLHLYQLISHLTKILKTNLGFPQSCRPKYRVIQKREISSFFAFSFEKNFFLTFFLKMPYLGVIFCEKSFAHIPVKMLHSF